MLYAKLEGRPVIITDADRCIGYWLIDGKWVEMHPADTTQAALLDKARFDKLFSRAVAAALAPTNYRHTRPKSLKIKGGQAV